MQLQWDSMLIEVNVICLWLELDSLFSLKTASDIWLSDTYSSYVHNTQKNKLPNIKTVKMHKL